ncbi:hypothetical protein [Pedobacter kyonggii]|uniref:hypothetical protein n=1 Tax=Pedobacter kyonggii TaxID=1926871 RepID=UPI0013EF4E73|nr:hypothetical protein [Pedobacter kyonggii]
MIKDHEKNLQVLERILQAIALEESSALSAEEAEIYGTSHADELTAGEGGEDG